MAENHPETLREAVGLFRDMDSMQNTIDELERSGFGRQDISILGSEEQVKERFGAEHVRSRRLEDHPAAPRRADIKREEVGVGKGVVIGACMIAGVILALLVTGVTPTVGPMILAGVLGLGGGGALGVVLANLLGDKYKDYFQRQIQEGGMLLWVTTPTPEMESRAQAILKQHGAKDVHVHELAATGGEPSRLEADKVQSAYKKMEHVTDDHRAILSEDRLMSEKLNRIQHSLKDVVEDRQPLYLARAETIAGELEEAARYAKDMAEEEQRVVEESHVQADGNEEVEVVRYFALSKDLSDVAEKYRQEVLQAKAA